VGGKTVSKFQVDWEADKRTILGKLSPDFDVRTDMEALSKRMVELLEQAEKPVSFLFDMTEISMSFGDMVSAMADLTKGEQAAWRHNNLKELLIISEQSMLELGAEALRRTQYGKLRSWFFSTMDEARQYLQLTQGPASPPPVAPTTPPASP
jgi:hypothetical protein